MKRKFSLFLNVAMLALCVCAIAIGVYSAKQASLNVTGTIGFKAHNCDVNIVGYIYGHSLTPDGTPVPKPTQNSEKKYLVYGDSNTSTGTTPLEVRGDNTKSLSFNINSGENKGVYFSDMGESGNPEEIKIVIQVTNISEFNVIATPNITASTSTGNKVAISADRSAVVINQGEATAQDITFSLRLLPDSNGNYTTLTSAVIISLQMDFAKTNLDNASYKGYGYVSKFTPTEQSNIREKLFKDFCGSDDLLNNKALLCYAERYPYYVEMGTDPTINSTTVSNNPTGKLRWLIVGRMDNTTDAISALTNEDIAALESGLMLKSDSFSYCLLSENCLYPEITSNYGLIFQNDYTYDDSTVTGKNNQYSDVNANDYATSNIRSYLKGNAVQSSCEQTTITNGYKITPYGAYVNLYTTYNLDKDALYTHIQSRSLESLYKKMSDSDGSDGDTELDDVTVPTNSTIDSSADELWLLSLAEVQNIFGADIYYLDAEINFHVCAITSGQGVTGSHWWIRTPESSYSFYAHYFLSTGQLGGNDAGSSSIGGSAIGVRAAFKI